MAASKVLRRLDHREKLKLVDFKCWVDELNSLM